ncbi:hypothetical protein DMENIID0001_111390 [Sergentomyia squamirostris]
MRNFSVFCVLFTLTSFASVVLTLKCYTCDSTDLDYEFYEDCDTHFHNMGEEECVMNDTEFHKPEDYVCYRTVYFHKHDGYVITRGCEVKTICSDLENIARNLPNNAYAIPTECQTCENDLCDPVQLPSDEWINENCHELESTHDTLCEDDDMNGQ